jgi:O-antigen/teichoic acid export membrane protein
VTEAPQLSPLRRSVVSGVKWGSASAGAIFVLGLTQTAVLAHLLDPSDFGLMAASLVVIGLARAFADLGLSSAIVAKRVRDHNTLSSLYWASLIAGVAMFGIVLALMPLMVRFYREPELYHVLPWAALSFAIIPIGQQFQMLLQMDLHVDRLVKVDVASAVVALLVAVFFGVTGSASWPHGWLESTPPNSWGPVPLESWLIAGALYVALVAAVRAAGPVRDALGFPRHVRDEEIGTGAIADVATVTVAGT